MVDKHVFLEYRTEELLDDTEFFQWLKGRRKSDELDSLVLQYPDFAEKVAMARRISQVLQDKPKPVLREDIRDIWSHIEDFDERRHRRAVHFSLVSMFKNAAVLALLVAIAGLIWLRNRDEKTAVTNLFSNTSTPEQSKLILSNGQVIDLARKESTVAYNSRDKIVRINNDSVVGITAPPAGKVTEMNKVVVPYGRKSTIDLPDGTRVWLNAGSKFAFPDQFAEGSRQVVLDGEAFFEVSKDPGRPFLVQTKDLTIKVLGTKFDLSAYSADLDVITILVEGSVSLRKSSELRLLSQETLLHPRQKAVFNKFQQKMVITDEPDTEQYTAWRDGWFPFRKVSLSEVFKRLERYYNVRITYPGNFPSDDLISGKLDLKDSIEEVMKVLKDVADLSYRIDNNNVLVEKNDKMPMRNPRF